MTILKNCNILYLGNFLSGVSKTPSPNVIIVDLLKSFYIVRCASTFYFPMLRFFSMVFKTLTLKFHSNPIIIIDVFSTSAFWFAFINNELAKILKIPTILVLHGGNLPFRFKTSPKLSKRLLLNAKSIVSPSNYLKSHAQNLSDKNVTVINNPIIFNEYPFFQKTYGGIHLLWVRSFHQIYRPEMAIEVCRLLKVSWPKLQITMIGPDKDGSLLKVQKLADEYNLSSQLHLKGYMSKSDWIKESKSANIFINTTSIDNTPVSVIEALALGFPVVSTNVGGIPYLLQHDENAILIDDGDVGAMVSAIERIMSDSELRDMLIRNGRALATQMDIRIIMEKWKVVINEVVS